MTTSAMMTSFRYFGVCSMWYCSIIPQSVYSVSRALPAAPPPPPWVLPFQIAELS